MLFKIIKIHLYLSLIFIVFIVTEVHADELDELADTSRELIGEFSGKLINELTTALNEGGPENAIKVCKVKAPWISNELSRDGWSVRRTSLKIRNPDNAPDEFEEALLREFEEKKSAGYDIDKLAYYKLTEIGTHSEFRYIKAIPVNEICLQCHGEYISEPVVKRLDELYPEDKARNYKLGDIRGAFTLRKVFKRDVPELEQTPLNGPVNLPEYKE